MSGKTPLDPVWDAAGVVAPLAAVAVAILAGWPWWAAALFVGAVTGAYSRLAGRDRGVVSSLFATAGLVLLVERRGARPVPVRLAELGVMVVLLALAAVVGSHRPQT